MKNIQEIVQNLSHAQKLQVIEDYEQFSKDGFIGDCLLRTQADALGKIYKTADHVTFWMMDIANGCYKHFAQKYLELLKEDEHD